MVALMHPIRHALEQRKYSKRTVDSYLGWVHEFEQFLSPRDTTTASTNDVSRFFRHLSRNRSLSNQSVRQAASAISFLVREVLGDESLATVIPVIKVSRPIPEVPTQREIFSLIEKVRNPTVQIALKCVYGMGLETQEALSLRVRDLDFKNGTAKITTQRRRPPRFTPIPQFALDELQKLTLGQPPDTRVFRSKAGEAYRGQTLQRELALARKTCGVKQQYTMRSFRHAYVVHLNLLGIPLKDVLDHVGMHNRGGLQFYSVLAGPPVGVTFSPADRSITNEDQALARESVVYVSEERINQLSTVNNESWDTGKLVVLLRELNASYRARSYMAIAMLVRSVINHIPPILGFQTFNEVVNNYSGSSSFKKAMSHLNSSLRNVADSHLHLPIRQKEDLPTFVQVDFRADLDHLLGELFRVLRRAKP